MTARLISPRSASLALPATTRPDGVPSIRWPSQVALLRRLVCGHCGAAVIVDDAPSASSPLVDLACQMCSRVICELRHDQMPAPMTPAQFHALPGGYAKRGAPSPPPSPSPRKRYGPPCADCGKHVMRSDATRCADCENIRKRVKGHIGHLVAILQRGPTHRDDLGRRMGVSWDSLRSVIQRARKAGHRIARVGAGLYRLEVAP